jgi:hypothetical protein
MMTGFNDFLFQQLIAVALVDDALSCVQGCACEKLSS